MGRFRFLLAALALMVTACAPPAADEHLPPDPALARTHALFVGVNDYRYADGHGLQKLKGAVGDALRFKAALKTLFGFDSGEIAQGECEVRTTAAITLTDACATRKAILAALNDQVKAAKAGDTVLFYFAGHGAAVLDTTEHDQDTGFNGTILGYDARKPGATPEEIGEIWDIELRQIKEQAVAAGVYFVTIFDSCNSATATRADAAGQSRNAPPPTMSPPMPSPMPSPMPRPGLQTVPVAASAATGPQGYWVHLAAAQDGEDAREVAQGGAGGDTHAGVFTNALIETLQQPSFRHATFGEIIRQVQLLVGMNGATQQHPSGEGDLTAALGQASAAPLLFPAKGAGREITMQAGTLSGVTSGSRYALYASESDAVAKRPPFATARVSTVEAMRATLAIEGPGVRSQTYYALETAHFLPPDKLGVRVAEGPLQQTLTTALAPLGFARVDGAGAVRLDVRADDPLGVQLLASDGAVLADLGHADAPEFAAALERELRKVARVQQLLSLQTAPAGSGSGPAVRLPYALEACVSTDTDRGGCPSLGKGALRRIDKGAHFSARMSNEGTKPAYLYLLAIDPRNAVTLVVPRRGENDRPIAPYRKNGRNGIWSNLPGLYRFVAIASATPIRADAFEQSGNGTRGTDACTTPLERLICSANDGARDGSVTGVGDWAAEVTTMVIDEQKGG